MKKNMTIAILILLVVVTFAQDKWEKQNSCLSCHRGIESIRQAQTPMFRRILLVAENSGTNNRCIVCHGGNPEISLPQGVEKASPKYLQLKRQAHSGTIAAFAGKDKRGPDMFYPDPSSPWINDQTCGMCHEWEVEAQWKSLMMTEAGKIQGTLWGFGGKTGYRHKYANQNVKNPAPDKIIGTEAYKKYLLELTKKNPEVFVDSMQMLPEAPIGGDDVLKDPSKAAYTYIRGECQRCHLGVGGKQRYGDYRGLGCSACHIPYSNSGYYEGTDMAQNHSMAGKPLVHSIQATGNSVVKTQKLSYTGIPVETCTTCHNRGRRIGVSYQGLMETPYGSPWAKDGSPQQKLHGKHYIQLEKDLHNAKGFLCQDCHTTLDVHSDNKLTGAITAAVEIECSDCHGTPEKFPWELPLGYGDEYSEETKSGPARGLATTLPDFMRKGKVYPPQDGYLLSARGNPLGNAVRKGNKVIVHLASGKDHELSPLKLQAQEEEFSLEGKVAMVQVKKHMERLECYACHATWAPQCYGCHLKVDYSTGKNTYDWVKLGQKHKPNGMTKEYTEEGEKLKIPGEIVESRSYLRWENPALAQNGEGRISPVVPGCQTSVTVVNNKGKVPLLNHIFRIPNVEGAGKEGQLGTDMAPLYPHTVQKKARSCESCHDDPKALGYGINGGKFYADPSQDHYVDLMTGSGEVIPEKSSPQTNAVPNLSHDWSRFVSEDGKQLQTVGHHFKLSRPLSNEERSHMERQGICLGCHREIPEESLAVNILHHIAETVGMMPKNNEEHTALVNKTLLLSGWLQIVAMAVGVLVGLIAAFVVTRKMRKAKAKK